MQLLVQKVLLQRRGDRGLDIRRQLKDHAIGTMAAHLSTGAETGQPDGRALLADELGSFFVRDGACGRERLASGTQDP